ncbi:MAG: hypothetical protein M0P70_13950 [Desulfobulbaceae bacterium]|nr:hypothetical protein [Desulfobulbaceae bacterium]
MTKDESGLNKFKQVNNFFIKTLELRYTSMIRDLKDYFFQGFEWKNKINIKKAYTIEEISLSTNDLLIIPKELKNKNKVSMELARFFKRLGIQKNFAEK